MSVEDGRFFIEQGLAPFGKILVKGWIVKRELTKIEKLIVFLSALFHDIGKPEKFFTDDEGIGHFYGHPEAGAKIFDEISDSMLY